MAKRSKQTTPGRSTRPMTDEPAHPATRRTDRNEVDTSSTDHVVYRYRDAGPVRGGVSIGGVLTGMVVALGSMALLTAVVAGVLYATGNVDDLRAGSTLTFGVGAAVAFALAQLLSYLWGGYTAGRMARGAGALNGLLVPVAAIVFTAAATAVASWFGTQFRFAMPFQTTRFGFENDQLVYLGAGVGIATLLAMFGGAIAGGMLGARWHERLESDRVVTETVEEREITRR